MSKENNIYELSYTLRRELQKKVFSVISLFLVVIAFFTLFLRFVLFPVRQNTVSMTPEIAPNGWIMVTPLLKTPNRGDVVLLKPSHVEKHPSWIRIANNVVAFFTAQQIFPFTKDEHMGDSYELRRVVAVPGDTLYITGYVLFIKPKGASDYLTEFEHTTTPYKVNIATSPERWDGTLGAQANYQQITLKEDEYFVMADNRNACIDSRMWGPVPASRIKGKALMQYFPFNKFHLF
ncbi:MAG: signal peptidase I [Treponema sp.]|nr:signal peptidase I [Treponema sp.]